jgi:anti-sigma B factor antagonist
MDLQLNRREKEGASIIDLRGRLVIGESEARLRESVGLLARKGADNVILNFAEVTEIDEDGLDSLDLCRAMVRRSGGRLKLLNLRNIRINSSELIRLFEQFETFEDEQEAINSCFPGRAIRHFDVLKYVEEQEEETEQE